jgi:hypothetical protein
MPEEYEDQELNEELHEHNSAHGDYPSHEDYIKAQKITFEDIKEHITGPILSVIVHIILLFALGTIVIFEAPEEREDIAVEVTEMELKEIEKIPEPPRPPEEVMDEIEVEIDRPDVENTKVNVEVDNVSVQDVNVDVSMPDLLSVKPSNSALILPGVYKARASAGGRKSAIKRYGGGVVDPEKVEKAVEKGLNWLATHQNADGSWGTYNQAKYQYTAMATLAFLAHGDTPVSQKYGQTIIKAIKIMLKWSKYRGAYLSGSWHAYDHAIVAYALSEAYGITKMPKIKDAMNKMVQHLIDSINNRGSYTYGYRRNPHIQRKDRDPITGRLLRGKRPEPSCDLSFAGWNYQTLKAAFSAGCDLPELQKTVDRAIKGLKYHAYPGKSGGFGIHPHSRPDFGMTGVGILCLGLLGEGKSKEARKAYNWLKSYTEIITTCSWRYNEKIHKKYPKAFTHALYTWYYLTQVIFQHTKGKGGVWKRWNRAFARAYLKEQEPDGSWSTPAQKYGQQLDPNKVNAEWKHVPRYAQENDLKIYATTLCLLTLEVYYRYLPTYRLGKAATKKASLLDEEDDLGLKIE